jgi:hypothetical protein
VGAVINTQWFLNIRIAFLWPEVILNEFIFCHNRFTSTLIVALTFSCPSIL